MDETTITAAIAHLHTIFEGDSTVGIDQAAEQAIRDYILNGDPAWTPEQLAQHHQYIQDAPVDELASIAYVGVFKPTIEPRRLYNDETLAPELYDL